MALEIVGPFGFHGVAGPMAPCLLFQPPPQRLLVETLNDIIY